MKSITDFREFDREPEPGDICLCGINTLGVITRPGKHEVEYDDGNTAQAYVGLHIESHPDKGIERGDKWSSQDPYIVTTTEELRDYALGTLLIKDKQERQE